MISYILTNHFQDQPSICLQFLQFIHLMMDIKSESTCENQSLSLSNSNFDQAKAQEMLITPHVLDPLTPHSSGWDHQIHEET